MEGATACRERPRLFVERVRQFLTSSFCCVLIPVNHEAPQPAARAINPGYSVIVKKSAGARLTARALDHTPEGQQPRT